MGAQQLWLVLPVWFANVGHPVVRSVYHVQRPCCGRAASYHMHAMHPWLVLATNSRLKMLAGRLITDAFVCLSWIAVWHAQDGQHRMAESWDECSGADIITEYNSVCKQCV